MPRAQTGTAKNDKTPAEWEDWLLRVVQRYPAHLRDDLMQEARLGLWTARQRYKTEGAARFTTYARRYVVGRILQYQRDKEKTIRVSGGAHEKQLWIACISNLVEDRGGRDGFAFDYYDEAPPWDAPERSLESTCLINVQAQRVKSELTVLTERQRTFVWMVVEGYTFVEIGRQFGIRHETARDSFYRAKTRVAGGLNRKGFTLDYA